MSFGKRKPKKISKKEILKQKFLSNKTNKTIVNEKTVDENFTKNKRVGKRKLQKIELSKGKTAEGDNNRCFLDIESTGVRKNDRVLIVGLLCNDEFTQFVDTIDLLPNVIEKYIEENHITEVIGFNSRAFDVRFLKERHHLKEETVDRLISTDLRVECTKLNIKGSLKEIEKHFGISRQIEPISYEEQQKLWNRWIANEDEKALKDFLTYNEDDVINLQILEDILWGYEKEQGDKSGTKKTKK